MDLLVSIRFFRSASVVEDSAMFLISCFDPSWQTIMVRVLVIFIGVAFVWCLVFGACSIETGIFNVLHGLSRNLK